MYAIQALACLENSGRCGRFVRDIAKRTGVPRAYLARIINRLAHQGIVATKRGYQGGASLARPANGISLLEVVEAVEGKDWIGPFLLGKSCCAEFIFPDRDFWQEIRRQIEDKLSQTTMAEVIASQSVSKRASARTLCSIASNAASSPGGLPHKPGSPTGIIGSA